MSRPMGVTKKRAGALATSSPEVVRVLMQLSKAALVDLVAEMIALEQGHGDDPAPVGVILDRIEPVLIVRGDRMPASGGRLAESPVHPLPPVPVDATDAELFRRPPSVDELRAVRAAP